MHPQMYSLRQLRVKSLAQGQLNKRFWGGGVWYMLPSLEKVGNEKGLDEEALASNTYPMKDEPSLRLHPKVIHQDSLVHQFFHWFLWLFLSLLVKSKAPLSLVSKCKKNSKEDDTNHSYSHGCFISCQIHSQIQQRAILPSPGRFSKVLWLHPYKLCCRGYQTCKEEHRYAGLGFSLQSTAVELEMKWVKEI